MQFKFYREDLLTLLQKVMGAIERKQATLPVLANVLIVLDNDKLNLTGTDLELELKATGSVQEVIAEGRITVPARTLQEIIKAMPENELIDFISHNDKVKIQCGKTKFSIGSISAESFPDTEKTDSEATFKISKEVLKELLHTTGFAMAQQDVRYFLNGLLFEFFPDKIRTVATDGHRLATNVLSTDTGVLNPIKIIVPRKTIQELLKILSEESEVELSVGENVFQVKTDGYTMLSRVVEGKFPNYERVIPRGEGQKVLVDRECLKEALQRTSAITKDRTKAANLTFKDNKIIIFAVNSEHDEVEESIDVEYGGKELTIGFNAGYLMDFLQIINDKQFVLTVSDPASSALLMPQGDTSFLYVVMPMRL